VLKNSQFNLAHGTNETEKVIKKVTTKMDMFRKIVTVRVHGISLDTKD